MLPQQQQTEEELKTEMPQDVAPTTADRGRAENGKASRFCLNSSRERKIKTGKSSKGCYNISRERKRRE